MSVDVLNESDFSLDEMELVACARYVMGQMKVHSQADLCVKLVDESAMEVLHKQWMDLPGPTDVMSFPMDELRPGRDEQEPTEGVLGDVVMCPQVVGEEWQAPLIHAVLHLVGYDHGAEMEARETQHR